jgi:excisionase family DNA binding protein
MKSKNILLKDILSFKEGCQYTGISASTMYKHTSNRTIPYYKPNKKLIYFKRAELDKWMLSNRQSSKDELEAEASKESLGWRNKFLNQSS